MMYFRLEVKGQRLKVKDQRLNYEGMELVGVSEVSPHRHVHGLGLSVCLNTSSTVM